VRLWSLHPRYLDRQGLTAAWREALLAQAVLAGRTRGYRHHPQLRRFQAQLEPVDSVGAFLVGLAEEAERRGYRFDRTRILQPCGQHRPITVTEGQLEHEYAHLLAKLRARSPQWLAGHEVAGQLPDPHPLFTVVAGEVEDWEVRGAGVRPAR